MVLVEVVVVVVVVAVVMKWTQNRGFGLLMKLHEAVLHSQIDPKLIH